MANPVPSYEILPGGLRETDKLFHETHDGSCSRCGQQIAEREVPLLLWPESAGGHDMYAFCERCAFDPDSDRCRICGCSERNPCDEPCAWAEPGLCTNCVDEARAAAG